MFENELIILVNTYLFKLFTYEFIKLSITVIKMRFVFILFLEYQLSSAAEDPLENYNADISTATVSGFSGGSAFAM